MTSYLVLTDVDAIQRYVFASVRMSAIVGASAIVAKFDEDLKSRAKADYGALRAVLSGGNGMFVFPDHFKAGEFADHAGRSFRQASVVGTLTASDVTAFDGDPEFPESLKKALDSLEKKKRLGAEMPASVEFGQSRQCEYCGSEPAGPDPRVVGDDTWYVGRACRAKLDARDAWRNEEAHRSDVQDFNKLAGDDDYLAIIVIDGDGLGQRLQHSSTPAAYEEFSENVTRVVECAIQAGWAACRSVSVGGKKPDSPYQLLYRGGDDIVLACRSQWALPFVEAFSGALDREDWGWAGPEGRIGFSVGITIARSGFPFRVSHQIASGLLRNAKRAAASQEPRWNEGAIDFAMITESSGDADAILRDREIPLEDRPGICLTGRPYRLTANEPHSLSRLRQACQELRQFPRGRLFGLRNMLTASAWSDGKNPAELAANCAKLNKLLAAWSARVERVRELSSAWRRAYDKLPTAAEPVASDKPCPYGDFADALYLWEKYFENQH